MHKLEKRNKREVSWKQRQNSRIDEGDQGDREEWEELRMKSTK